MALQSFYSSYGFAYLWLERRFNFNTASWTQQHMCWVQCGSGMQRHALLESFCQAAMQPDTWMMGSELDNSHWFGGLNPRQQQQQWQQWQQQQLQQQQLQQQQMQAQMQMQQQMQWQAEQQKLQQQQLQAQWNQQQWAQHLQQSQQSMQQPVIQQPVMQPMQTMQPNQSGAPQQVRFWQNPCGRETVWFDVDLFSKPARRTRRWTRKFFGCSRRQCMVLSYLTLVITWVKLLCSKCSKLLCQARAETATSPKKPEVGLTSLVERCQHFLV